MADDKEDDFFDQVSAMAERLGLKGDKRKRYIHDHMTQAGYDWEPSYFKADRGDDDGDSFSPFGSRGGSGAGSGRRRTSRRNDDDDSRGGKGWFD